jgi:hypothetical protein
MKNFKGRYKKLYYTKIVNVFDKKWCWKKENMQNNGYL